MTCILVPVLIAKTASALVTIPLNIAKSIWYQDLEYITPGPVTKELKAKLDQALGWEAECICRAIQGCGQILLTFLAPIKILVRGSLTYFQGWPSFESDAGVQQLAKELSDIYGANKEDQYNRDEPDEWDNVNDAIKELTFNLGKNIKADFPGSMAAKDKEKLAQTAPLYGYTLHHEKIVSYQTLLAKFCQKYDRANQQGRSFASAKASEYAKS